MGDGVMTVLPELLREIADDVAPYDVGGRALARARRRRRVHRATSAVAAAVVVLAVVGLAAVPFHHTVEPVTAALPWLPAQVPPAADVPPLPADRGVGPGALVYIPCASDCTPVLVLPDATQYAIPSPRRAGTGGVALSPDGRWLVYPDDQGRSVIRDLASAATTAWPASRPRVWSPEGRWLVLVQDQPSGAPVAVVIELPIGGYHLVDAVNGAGLGLVAILDSGQLVYAGTPVKGSTPRVQVLDGFDRQVEREFTVSLPLAFAPTIRPYQPLFPENRTGRTFLAQGTDRDVVRVDGFSGALLHRYPLPVVSSGGWLLGAVVGKAAVMTRMSEVGILDRATGMVSTVCLVRDSYFSPVVRGSVG
jgi:hypothetical protein